MKIDVNKFYYNCVDVMHSLAKITDTTYEEINIVVFLILNPAIAIVLFVLAIYQFIKIRKLRSIIRNP